MTRKADAAGRLALLERIVAYTFDNGIASLSLRPLAKDLGVSPGLLLYHFRSKEELTVEILVHVGERQRDLFAQLRTGENASAGDVCRAVWGVIGAPAARPLFRVFFEAYGLSLARPDRFPAFFPAAVENWLAFLAEPYAREGASPSEARARATIVLAIFRGFLLDVCATNDDTRIARAVTLWTETLT